MPYRGFLFQNPIHKINRIFLLNDLVRISPPVRNHLSCFVWCCMLIASFTLLAYLLFRPSDIYSDMALDLGLYSPFTAWFPGLGTRFWFYLCLLYVWLCHRLTSFDWSKRIAHLSVARRQISSRHIFERSPGVKHITFQAWTPYL